MVAPLDCPDDVDLFEFAIGGLRPEQRDEVDAHIDGCAACFEAVAASAFASAVGTAGASAGSGLQAGQTVGRYVVRERIGGGAMGEVFVAEDRELARDVAIKVLDARGPLPDAEVRLREARALARLSHPNVVAVYDVGTVDETGSVFIAMERVTGQTLTQWLETPRTWREIVATFSDAARGLVAAHARGIVHGDFKPDNVMLADDGRVLVLDLGLARTTSLDNEALEADTNPGPAHGDHRSWTRESSSVGFFGTPAYASPEQWAGQRVRPASDQFSFCVALYEALYAERPFAGTNARQLADAVSSGRVRAAPPGSSVPARLRRTVVRGLAPDPKARHASMDALLTELDASASRRFRARWWVGGLALLAVVAVASDPLGPTRDEQDCRERAESLREVWNPGVRERVRGAAISTDSPLGDDVAARTIPKLDDYARRWTDEARRRCDLAASIDPQPEAVVQHIDHCLAERRAEFAEAVRLFGPPDATSLQHAVVSVEHLMVPARCRDDEAEGRQSDAPTPARIAAAIGVIRDDLARARTLRRARQFDAALAIARRAAAEAVRVDWPLVVAQAQLEVGRVLADSGKAAEAVEALEKAYHGAVAAGDDRTTADAALSLVGQTIAASHAYTDASRWLGHARAALDRQTKPDPARLAEFHMARGRLRYSEGDYAQAASAYERAHAIRKQEFGAGALATAESLQALGIVARQRGQAELALEHHRAVVSVRERLLGPNHPSVAKTLELVGLDQLELGRPGEAVGTLERARDLAERSVGADHPVTISVLVALGNAQSFFGRHEAARQTVLRASRLAESSTTITNGTRSRLVGTLGAVYGRLGDYEESLVMMRRAATIREEILGSDHPQLAIALTNVAAALAMLERYDEAIATDQRALAIYERVFGEEHGLVAAQLANIGMNYARRGENAKALEVHERALRIATRLHGERSPQVARLLQVIGMEQQALGRYTDARRSFSRALEIREATLDADSTDVATSLYDVASSRADAGELDAARAQYEQALKIYEGHEHPAAASVLAALGDLERKRGKDGEALELYRRSLDAYERYLGRETFEYAGVLASFGELEAVRGDPDEGRAALERAIVVLEQRPRRPEPALARFALAKLLWSGPTRRRDRARAWALGAAALEGFRAAGDAWSEEADEVKAWIAHRSEP